MISNKIISFLIIFHLLFSYSSWPVVSAIEKQIQVTGTVNPTPNSFTVNLQTIKPELDEIYTSEIVPFTITVDSESYSPFPLEVKASWEDGLVEGSSGNYIPVYDYVLSSATSSLPGTTILIDLLNREITWQIPGMSKSGPMQPHELTFQLKVKPSFLTTSRILATVYADATYGSASSPQKSYQLYVNPNIAATPTPTPTPTFTPTLTPTPSPTNTPEPTFTITPTPTPTNTPTPTFTPTLTPIPSPTNTPTVVPSITVIATPTSKPPTITEAQVSPTPTVTTVVKVEEIIIEPPIFQKIDIENISATSALFTITASQDVVASATYDSCEKNKYGQTLISNSTGRYHEFYFQNLKQATPYCVVFNITNPLTKLSQSSEVFLFETAMLDAELALISTTTSWNGIFLSYRETEKVYVPESQDIVLTAQISNPEQIESVDGEFVNRSVLGVSTLAQSNISKVRFIELGKGFYSAEISSPKNIDDYLFTLEIKTKDKRYSKTVFDYSFQVTAPIVVVDKKGRPIESANISIERYESSTKRFVPFNSSFTLNKTSQAFSMPYQTRADGSFPIALPEGKYRIITSAIGYNNDASEFILGKDVERYPIILLDSNLTFGNVFKYVIDSFILGYKVLFADVQIYFGTRLLYTVGVVVQVLMIFILGLFGLVKLGLMNRFKSKFTVVINDFQHEIFSLFLGGWSLMSIVTAVFFILFQGLDSAIPFIFMSLIVFTLDILLFIKGEKDKLSLQSLKI
jgi:hypothetical protein